MMPGDSVSLSLSLSPPLHPLSISRSLSFLPRRNVSQIDFAINARPPVYDRGRNLPGKWRTIFLASLLVFRFALPGCLSLLFTRPGRRTPLIETFNAWSSLRARFFLPLFSIPLSLSLSFALSLRCARCLSPSLPFGQFRRRMRRWKIYGIPFFPLVVLLESAAVSAARRGLILLFF